MQIAPGDDFGQHVVFALSKIAKVPPASSRKYSVSFSNASDMIKKPKYSLFVSLPEPSAMFTGTLNAASLSQLAKPNRFSAGNRCLCL